MGPGLHILTRRVPPPPPKDTCLVCNKHPKRRDYQFCSDGCTAQVTNQAYPHLIRVPEDHIFFANVTSQFSSNWLSSKPMPRVHKIYLITWPREMRNSFQKYRSEISNRFRIDESSLPAESRSYHAKRPAEIKAFRSERRSCQLGETRKNLELCSGECRLCQAIRTGFGSSLRHKREMVRKNSKSGVRFGAGVYMTPQSNKAYQYAKDMNPGSKYKAVLVTRVVLGKQEELRAENTMLERPSPGFDSVLGVAAGGEDSEYIVYHEDAVRPAYLLMVDPVDSDCDSEPTSAV
ncbi:hypothetical protein BKA62DRAFT_45615 [Auriculariales sp. MPI-PUGE-AT-0066]|nr:hypothetical protein BKA62DRAFT_45615 [Auriculariales sp. MPI-PUGE-AT-0066]